MASKSLFLFGDQTVESYHSIKDLARYSQYSLSLKTFFRDSRSALHSAIAQLHTSERGRFSSFDSILGLAEAHVESGVNDIVLSTVLLCFAQLGSLICHSENDARILDSTVTSEVYILGLCTGLLPAAAAATAESTVELLKLAPEILCISLRLALEADHRSNQLEQSRESWAFAVPGVPATELQKAIDSFHENHVIPPCKRVYISAEADSSITISGPPSVLALFTSSSDTLSNISKVPLRIAAAFHAQHLGKPASERIVGASSLLGRYLKKNAHIMSTGSGTRFEADTLNALLPRIVDEILQTPLYWARTLQSLVPSLAKSEVTLMAFGPTNVTKSLKRTLETSGIKVTETAKIDLRSPQGLIEQSDDIAIIGMACRLPGSDSLEEFWKVLEHGRDLHAKIPKDRFDVDSHCNSSGATKDTIMTPFGCFINRPGFFDARLFNMSPREAAQTDPTHRLILMTTYEALEMAGYSPNSSLSTRGHRIGTFFGQTTDDWREWNASQDIDMYYVSGCLRPFGPGRLNYHFKWEGPSYSIDAACSSSSVSVQMACTALLTRECDTAVAGGGNLITGPNMFAGLTRGSFLSASGSCKTFDDDADGYCRGEGVGTVILKRLKDAIADRDNIQGVIKSIATNHSAFAVSITHPDVGAQQRLYRQVLQKACIDPSEVQYMEMHGTGTQAGDSTEVESATSVFGKNRKRDNPLYIGSVKPNVGHGEAVAGVTSLIKAMMMFQKNIIPPHAGIKGRINHKFPPLDKMNIQIVESPIAFKPLKACTGRNGKRKIFLNNFNATGGNTSMLLEEAPETPAKGEDPRSTHVVVTSARTLTSLMSNKQHLLEYLTLNAQTKPADLSYTSTARRMHHGFRTAFAVANTTELVGLIAKEVAEAKEPSRTLKPPSIVFLFTGQGSHYPGMGKQIFETSASFRKNIIEFNDICIRQGQPSFLSMFLDADSDMKNVTQVQIQLGLVSLELSLAILWQSWGLKPDVIIGHSLGEYPALCFAGVLSVADMFFLVINRGELLQKNCAAYTHSMLAIAAGADSLGPFLTPACEIACINSPESTVISGTAEDINMVKARLDLGGIKATMLKVPFAFHSPQMDSVCTDLESLAQNVTFARPTVPVASTLTSSLIYTEGVFSANYLARQTRNKVNFLGALEACRSSGITDERTLWIETGPSPVCLGLVRATIQLPPAMSLPSLRQNEDCWKTISKSIANAYNGGSDVLWYNYHREYENALRLLPLPTYAFDLKDYWIQNEGRKKDQLSGTLTTDFSTTCLQHVESETYSKEGASVTFVSNAAEPNLYAAIQGHLVNGVGLCPSSVYADMAFTAASYIYSKVKPSIPVPAMDVSCMEVFHPLVVLPNTTQQLIKISAVWSIGPNTTEIRFSSQEGTDSKEHGRCTVRYGDGDVWKAEWARNAYLVQSRVNALAESAKAGLTHRILRPMVYKLFSALVVYDKKYQGLTDVFMDSNLHEASANVKFDKTTSNGDFTYSPYWIDSIVHLAGFVLNGHFTTPEDRVYISHGWKTLQISGPLSEEKSYGSYVRMQPVPGSRGVMAGDVYVFEGDEVIAMCTGLKFQELKKSILHSLLLGSSKVPAQKTANRLSLEKGPTASSGVKKTSKATARAAGMKMKADSPAPQSLFSRTLDIIAQEVRLDRDEFVDGAAFTELGIDSLLIISIISSLQAQLALHLPTSIFATYSTVAELRKFFEDEFGGAKEAEFDNESSSDTSDDVDNFSPSTGTISSIDSPDVAEVFISAVATETGIDPNEIEPSTLFTELGVESLMSIAVLSTVKDRTGVMLPASFFNEYPTVADVRKALQNTVEVSQTGPADLKTALKKALNPSSGRSTKKYLSKTVFLQGHLNSGLTPLILIADGAGSAASYINLPPFPSGLPVYALESPFLYAPLEYNLSFEAVASIYVDEIRNIQPHGPYMLGGWSLGGMHAYEVSRQLIAAGESVKTLIMIDSPCPKALPHMPDPTVELMEQTGIFIGIKRAGKPDQPMSLSTKQHLVQCVKALKVYDPIPIPAARRPEHTFIIWAKDGTFEKMSDQVAELTARQESAATNSTTAGSTDTGLRKDWLTTSRKSFGPNGWDRLVGDNIECVAMDGDHFSIMNPPKIKYTGEFIKGFLEKVMC